MASVNKVILIGNLGKDPELRHTSSGTAVATVSVATNEKWTKDGETHEKVEWHSVVTWGRTAENVVKYLSKGSSIYVEGKLQTRDWEKDGVKHYKTEVVAQFVQFLGGGGNGGSRGGNGGGRGGSGQESKAPDYDDDDIPF